LPVALAGAIADYVYWGKQVMADLAISTMLGYAAGVKKSAGKTIQMAFISGE